MENANLAGSGSQHYWVLQPSPNLDGYPSKFGCLYEGGVIGKLVYVR